MSGDDARGGGRGGEGGDERRRDDRGGGGVGGIGDGRGDYGGRYKDRDGGENGEEDDVNRPRRASPDTVKYLRSLPLDVRAAEEEVRTYVEALRDGKKEEGEDEEVGGEAEYPQMLSASLAAIDEVKNELASLCCEEGGSQAIETLARIAAVRSRQAARAMLTGVRGYALHLSCHRFGSHALQTIVGCAAGGCDPETERALISEEDDDEGEGEGEASLTDLVAEIASELIPHASDLAVHVCGSHVLRTVLSTLAGMELIDPSQRRPGPAGSGGPTMLLEGGGARRGRFKDKKKKKNKKKGPDHDEEGRAGGGPGESEPRRLAHPRVDPSDERMTGALRSLSDAVSAIADEGDGGDGTGIPKSSEELRKARPPGRLQQLSCHPSAGPLLAVLLRVLARRDAVAEEKDDEDDPAVAAKKASSDRRLGIIPSEPQYTDGSDADRFARLLLCWDSSADAAAGGGGRRRTSRSTRRM